MKEIVIITTMVISDGTERYIKHIARLIRICLRNQNSLWRVITADLSKADFVIIIQTASLIVEKQGIQL